MKIDSLYIENFKSIESAQIKEIDNAFILVGRIIPVKVPL